MENQQAQINMMIMFERMLQEQWAMSEVAAAVEQLVQRHGQFNGKDVSRYLRDYKSEMLRCGISEGLPVLLFNRVATELTYSMEHTSKTTRRGFEDWVETLKRGSKVLEVFTDFEQGFGRLSVRDQMILVPNKVPMTIRVVDFQDRHDLGTLLEDVATNNGLTDEWDDVRNSVT